MDEYVADGGFYMEEFGKYGSPVWAFLLWCEALERLGDGAGEPITELLPAPEQRGRVESENE